MPTRSRKCWRSAPRLSHTDISDAKAEARTYIKMRTIGVAVGATSLLIGVLSIVVAFSRWLAANVVGSASNILLLAVAVASGAGVLVCVCLFFYSTNAISQVQKDLSSAIRRRYSEYSLIALHECRGLSAIYMHNPADVAFSLTANFFHINECAFWFIEQVAVMPGTWMLYDVAMMRCQSNVSSIRQVLQKQNKLHDYRSNCQNRSQYRSIEEFRLFWVPEKDEGCWADISLDSFVRPNAYCGRYSAPMASVRNTIPRVRNDHDADELVCHGVVDGRSGIVHPNTSCANKAGGAQATTAAIEAVGSGLMRFLGMSAQSTGRGKKRREETCRSRSEADTSCARSYPREGSATAPSLGFSAMALDEVDSPSSSLHLDRKSSATKTKWGKRRGSVWAAFRGREGAL